MASFTLTGNLVDVLQKKIYAAEITVEEGRITQITQSPASRHQPISFPDLLMLISH
jgi:adenine deaminase